MNAQLTSVRPSGYGALAFGLLLAAYFGVLTLVSGWNFTLAQFFQYWFYIVPLAAGFGVQIALFVYLKRLVGTPQGSGTVAAASGTTSTAAMISCCAHYLVNVAPVIGATGIVTFATQYQVEFLWVGLAFNAAGIAYIGSKVFNARKEHAQCAAA
jgi:Cu+-exporting ATPase